MKIYDYFNSSSEKCLCRCKICDTEYSEYELRKHIKIHPEYLAAKHKWKCYDVQFKCSLCHYKYSFGPRKVYYQSDPRISEIKQHIASMHINLKMCEKCFKIYNITKYPHHENECEA